MNTVLVFSREVSIPEMKFKFWSNCIDMMKMPFINFLLSAFVFGMRITQF